LCLLAASAAVLALLPLLAARAQQETEVYSARLSSVPLIGGGAPAGAGSATATLRGTTLEVTGTFEQLTRPAGGRGRGGGEPAPPTPSPATAARLHSGPLTAVRGDSFSDLTLAPATEGEAPGTSGTLAGSVELTPEQVDLLREERIYVQIYSEEAPEGHLFGWFLQ
jgi:hypothetical protein